VVTWGGSTSSYPVVECGAQVGRELRMHRRAERTEEQSVLHLAGRPHASRNAGALATDGFDGRIAAADTERRRQRLCAEGHEELYVGVEMAQVQWLTDASSPRAFTPMGLANDLGGIAQKPAVAQRAVPVCSAGPHAPWPREHRSHRW
jgi:hypothetical protein